MSDGQDVGPHALKIKGHIDHLARLGFPISPELGTDIILNSLPESFSHFVMNYNMRGVNKTLFELIQMLNTAENNIVKKKTNQVLMVNKGKGSRAKVRNKLLILRQTLPSSKRLSLSPKRTQFSSIAMRLDIGG